jgi:hypothetical protein
MIKLERPKLLDKLQIVAPALATTVVESTQLLCFDGKNVTAYNDHIAIRVKFASEFVGCVNGTLLLALLGSSDADHIRIDSNGKEMELKTAISRFHLALKPVESFTFKMPENAGDEIDVTTELTDAVKLCLLSVGTDANIADQLGITFIAGKAIIDLYATDNKTITHARVIPDTKLENAFYDRCIVPKEFCEQLAQAPEGTVLKIGNRHCRFATKEKTVIGSLVHSKSPYDFEATIKRHMSKTAQFETLPEKLKEALGRAVILSKASPQEVPTRARVVNEILTLETKSEVGVVTDSLDFAVSNLETSFDADLLLRACDHFIKLCITDRSIALCDVKGNKFLMASRGA